MTRCTLHTKVEDANGADVELVVKYHVHPEHARHAREGEIIFDDVQYVPEYPDLEPRGLSHSYWESLTDEQWAKLEDEVWDHWDKRYQPA